LEPLDTLRTCSDFLLFIFAPVSYLYPYATKLGWYSIFLLCCDKDSTIIFTPAACLTSTFIETRAGTNDCKIFLFAYNKKS
jgi:hypothetical protein